MDPAAPSPLLRSFERHLRAENRSDQTVATYLIGIRQAETFLTAARGTTLAAAAGPTWRPTWASCSPDGPPPPPPPTTRC
jgi:hypothetical protein